MKTLRASLFLLAVAASALTAFADDKGKAKEGDLDKIQGVWTGLLGDERKIPVVFTIKGKEVTVPFHVQIALMMNFSNHSF